MISFLSWQLLRKAYTSSRQSRGWKLHSKNNASSHYVKAESSTARIIRLVINVGADSSTATIIRVIAHIGAESSTASTLWSSDCSRKATVVAFKGKEPMPMFVRSSNMRSNHATLQGTNNARTLICTARGCTCTAVPIAMYRHRLPFHSYDDMR